MLFNPMPFRHRRFNKTNKGRKFVEKTELNHQAVTTLILIGPFSSLMLQASLYRGGYSRFTPY